MREITIRSPKLQRAGKKTLLMASVLLVVLVGCAVYVYMSNQEKPQQAAEIADVQDGTGQVAQTPDYQMLLPAGKSVVDLGGLARVSPPDKEPVFAFADKIGEISIIVSQQPLPGTFTSNTESEIAKLAEQFSATEKVHTSDTIAYIGTSKDGPQSAILAKDKLLILIKSSSKVSKQEWTTYINTLE